VENWKVVLFLLYYHCVDVLHVSSISEAGVILESPVHPVTEGDYLTLRCLYNRTSPSILRSDFYKNELLVQSQTIEMIIPTVSKSHEGFYYCKHPRGESPKSWISVRGESKIKKTPLKIILYNLHVDIKLICFSSLRI